jgi:ribosomal-protein-alanine N-acetyltransferase
MEPSTLPRLERLCAADAQGLLPLWSDAETVRFTNWTRVTGAEDCASRVGRLLARYAAGSRRMGPYVLRTGAGAVAGLAGIDAAEPFNGEHEVWYLLRRDLWGRGWGTLAVAELVRMMAASGSVTRAVATAVSANTASWRILERNGFRRTGAIPGGFDRNGLLLDLYAYERGFASAHDAANLGGAPAP